MYILYVDNFRGFTSTYLTLKPVNFLVGENSTGKTSIMKLISILSSPAFWLHGAFGENFDSFTDSFSDLKTLGSSKDFFEIGMYSSRGKSAQNTLAFKMKFIEHKSKPFLKEISYYNAFIDLQISIEGTYIKYRYEILNGSQPSGDEPLFFKEWISNNRLRNRELNKYPLSTRGISSILLHVYKLIFLKGDHKAFNGNEIDLPSFIDDLRWIDASRPAPRQLYSSSDNDSLSALKLLLRSDIPLVRLIFQKFGLDSGLYSEIEVEDLNKTGDSDNSFEIILKSPGKELTITNVGFGVSQILPLVVLPLYDSKLENKSSWFAVQAPEIHLHPRAQAAYGEFIYKCYERDKQSFIIETHSDYLIDRFRIRINKAFKEKLISSPGSIAQVIFFRSVHSGNKLDIIDVQEDGSYSDEQPKEFRDFFIREKFQLLNI